MRLLLLRHGQTHGNTAGALDTAVPGLDLTELGVRQAEAAARVLHQSGVDGIFVSPLVRTQQTAAPLAALSGLDPVVLDGVREISAGDYEMATDHDSILGYIGTVADWIEGRLDTRMSGAETGHEFLARYDAAVEQIAADGRRRAVIVSHGAAIRTWISQRVTGSSTHSKATEGLENTAAIELEGSPADGWEVVMWTSDALGGAFLEDETAPDPTGQAIEGDPEHDTVE
ncbi:histidine phosphatase family protein [Marmoricola sp. RAF53]|uniref:histidine phosphatase family protein n=1 Tax=Marmoricola sp. RAF53 TaxID=3233059 RepID=UPI003F9AC6EB